MKWTRTLFTYLCENTILNNNCINLNTHSNKYDFHVWPYMLTYNYTLEWPHQASKWTRLGPKSQCKVALIRWPL